MAKLVSAVDVYVGLGLVSPFREDILKKIISLLSHPFPRVSIISLLQQITNTIRYAMLPLMHCLF
jgi:hypothetical protein